MYFHSMMSNLQLLKVRDTKYAVRDRQNALLLHVVYAHDNFRTLSGRMVMVQFQYRLIMK